jgi:hypothetical protein
MEVLPEFRGSVALNGLLQPDCTNGLLSSEWHVDRLVTRRKLIVRIPRFALPLIGLICMSLSAAQSPSSPQPVAKNANPFSRFFGEWI